MVLAPVAGSSAGWLWELANTPCGLCMTAPNCSVHFIYEMFMLIDALPMAWQVDNATAVSDPKTKVPDNLVAMEELTKDGLLGAIKGPPCNTGVFRPGP